MRYRELFSYIVVVLLTVVPLLVAVAGAEAGVTPICPGRVAVTEMLKWPWTADWFLVALPGTPATIIGQASAQPGQESFLIRLDWLAGGGGVDGFLQSGHVEPHDEWVFRQIVPAAQLVVAPCVTRGAR